MATGPIDVHDDEMDVEKPGIANEESEQHTERFDFAGPHTFTICLHFILLSHEFATSKRGNIRTADVIDTFAKSNPKLDDVMDQLQKVARKYAKNLYVYIMEQNRKAYQLFNATPERNDLPTAYLVFDKRNGNFHAFYRRFDSGEYQTTFSRDEEYVSKIFHGLIASQHWPGDNLQETTPTITVNEGNPVPDTIKALDFSHLLVDQVQKLFSHVGPIIDGLHYYIKPADCSLDQINFSCPQATFAALRHRLQMLIKLTITAEEYDQINRPTSSSTESAETDQQTGLNHHDETIHSKNLLRIKPSLSLSSHSMVPPTTTADTLNEEIRLPQLKLRNQPARLRRHRTLKDVLDKTCPVVRIEGASQGASFLFEIAEKIKSYTKNEFYLGAHVTTYNTREHDQTFVIPTDTRIERGDLVKRNDLDCLIITGTDEFERATKGVFSKIHDTERAKLQKKWSFKMVSLFQDATINKALIDEKKLDWCRLMFALYIKLPDGHFMRVSPPIYSNLIEDTNGSQTIEVGNIHPGELCEKGGQLVYINLRQTVESKSHVRVWCNGQALDSNDFQLADVILSFESPARPTGRNELQIIVKKKDSSPAMNFSLNYRTHTGEHSEPCGEIVGQ